ncbi:amidohydrolase family protein [Novosphingobium resinovorum]|uniref:Amidohydrolase n=1 Tax=Novosphingobium resinovorum TaxID=158500 RepID=A0A1D8A5Y9_9SPHN|nr:MULTISPECIES: amidohydrolase family protein [Novosphingobium]AOR77522.1 amidohydrolase [Novosphingobium resinovorum]MBF7012944.1 amidohydrolase family protein [Novosphingobium sp. HR1a]WJM27679.1 amidohydrolase family protein [Novosphingobium resinovorum]
MNRLILAILLGAAPISVSAQDFAITNATVGTGDGSAPIEHATVVVRAGKIVSVGRDTAAPGGTQVIDGTGKWVTPGLFSAVTDLGLWDVEAVDDSNDTSAEKSPFNAALDVATALNPSSEHIAVSREGGVTRASVAPMNGASIFAGQGAVIDLGQDAAIVMKPRAFQYVELGESGARLSGGSRVAAHTALRNALREAREVAALPVGAQRQGDVLLTRADAAALAKVIDGTQTLYVGVERASDIRGVLALKAEFPRLDLVLVGATEGWLVAPEIAAAGVPVVTMPMRDLPATFETLAATMSNVGRMKKAGVKVAIGMFMGMDQPRNAPQQAGNLVALTKIPGASGLTWGEALAAITSIPAEISGFGGKAGVLAPGAAGDVVLWDGDPLELSSAPVSVWIDGVKQPVDSHQARLRERYKDLDETYLPKAYDW